MQWSGSYISCHDDVCFNCQKMNEHHRLHASCVEHPSPIAAVTHRVSVTNMRAVKKFMAHGRVEHSRVAFRQEGAAMWQEVRACTSQIWLVRIHQVPAAMNLRS